MNFATPGFLFINFPVISLFNRLSKRDEHFLKVIFLKTQSKASFASGLCFALKILRMLNTINDKTQIIKKINKVIFKKFVLQTYANSSSNKGHPVKSDKNVNC